MRNMSPLKNRPITRPIQLLLGCVWWLAAWPAFASEQGAAGHDDSIPRLILSLAIILMAAKLGGHFAVHAGQPPVYRTLPSADVAANVLSALKTCSEIQGQCG